MFLLLLMLDHYFTCSIIYQIWYSQIENHVSDAFRFANRNRMPFSVKFIFSHYEVFYEKRQTTVFYRGKGTAL